MYVWSISSYYEFARERKFIRYCVNQNQALNLFLPMDDVYYVIHEYRGQLAVSLDSHEFIH